MKKFFEEYGAVAIIVIVIAILLLVVGSVKGLDETTGKVNGSGVASVVGNAYSNAIDKFKNSFDETLASGNVPTSGPNGEALVSKTESQVGKYADIDGDGTVDGIIFADLSENKEGYYNNYYTGSAEINIRGHYKIDKCSNLKEYYSYNKNISTSPNKTVEVLTPIGNGNNRFYIMSLNDIGEFEWYYSSYGKINKQIVDTNFGKGYSNTKTMIQQWNEEACGKGNAGSRGDVWDKIQLKFGEGWFLPSRDEWSAYCDALNVSSTNYSNLGLSFSYWTSSLEDTTAVYIARTSGGYIDKSNLQSSSHVRLATTF